MTTGATIKDSINCIFMQEDGFEDEMVFKKDVEDDVGGVTEEVSQTGECSDLVKEEMASLTLSLHLNNVTEAMSWSTLVMFMICEIFCLEV